MNRDMHKAKGDLLGYLADDEQSAPRPEREGRKGGDVLETAKFIADTEKHFSHPLEQD